LLVADRFQVKVIGQGSGLDVQQRHELLGAFDLAALAALNPSGLQAPAIPSGRQALPPGKQAPLRLPLPGLQRQAPKAQPSQARVPQPAANRKPSIFNRANAALEPAA
jgi:hypothetical protein